MPDDVGGRFSVLTAVGLLPIAVSGADIDKLMEGAQAGRKEALENDFKDNGALQYAAVRNILLRKGKAIEVLANYCLLYTSFLQLYIYYNHMNHSNIKSWLYTTAKNYALNYNKKASREILGEDFTEEDFVRETVESA